MGLEYSGTRFKMGLEYCGTLSFELAEMGGIRI